MNRRQVLTTTAASAAAASLTAPFAPALAQTKKRRYAIVGTGSRGLGMWGRGIQQRWGASLLEVWSLLFPLFTGGPTEYAWRRSSLSPGTCQ